MAGARTLETEPVISWVAETHFDRVGLGKCNGSGKPVSISIDSQKPFSNEAEIVGVCSSCQQTVRAVPI